MKAQDVIKKNIEMFEKEFGEFTVQGKYDWGTRPRTRITGFTEQQIKQFLTSSHTSLTQAIFEDIGKMEVGHGNYHYGYEECCGKNTKEKRNSEAISDAHCKGFNQALSQVQEYLKKLI